MLKKILVVFGVLLALALVTIAVAAARYVPVIRPNTSVGPVVVGGLTSEEAEKKLRVWWGTAKKEQLQLRNRELADAKRRFTPATLGLELDDKASIGQLAFEGFWQRAGRSFGLSSDAGVSVKPVFTLNQERVSAVRKYVERFGLGRKPARARLLDGEVHRTPEISGLGLDDAAMLEAVSQAVLNGAKCELPLRQAEKHVPDAELDKITGVVSSFSTRFPQRQASRNNNIRVASGKLDGVVLMPGERLGFNETVGRRTVEGGFKLAGVYKNGKHDVDIGGGICQVSSTLYNAALLADLKIVRRQNHSLPVAYVPVGRDATVSYGSANLIFENNGTDPIAVSTHYQAGRLTIRILGRPDPTLHVSIERKELASWTHPVKYVDDPKLAPGKKKVLDKGGTGHRVAVYRIVSRNGAPPKRESLGISNYKGGPKVIAINRTPAKPLDAPPPIDTVGDRPTP